MKFLQAAIVLLLFSSLAFSQTTRTWDQSRFEEFEKGTAKGVAIRSAGTLELAPEAKQVTTTASTYVWAIASDAQGNVFAAAGSPSRVYRIAPNGATTVVLAPEELQVQAITVARDGTVFAATSPDGRVYRIQRNPMPVAGAQPRPANAQTKPAPQARTADGKPIELDPAYSASVYFEPRTKYIWALATDPNGRLYVATGDRGEIYRVEVTGAFALFFKSDEAHIRALAIDNNGNLIAGSDGSGLIYRITPRGEGFVLYSAPKKEITALTVDRTGNIYAAAAGDKRAATQAVGLPAPAVVTPPAPAMTPGTTTPLQMGVATAPLVASQVPIPGLGATGSEVYRIDVDGSPKRLWSSREDLVYALAFDSSNRLIAGTGNRGRIFSITERGEYTSLVKVSANQVIGFAPAGNGDIYAATSNLGKLFLLQNNVQREGMFDSDVFDAKVFSRWGRAEMRSTGNVELLTRSGNVDNPDRNWSNWARVDLATDAPISSPSARFLQWRAVLRSGQTAPSLDMVRMNYLPKNIGPEVDDVFVTIGQKLSATPRMISEALAASSPSTSSTASTSSSATTRDRDSVTVRWTARDENDDLLSYTLYYRGDNETRWKLLKEGLADRQYSFDTSLLPDGGYTVRVVATDAPVHSPGEALSDETESTRFEIDNTPPLISNLTARTEGTNLRISFSSADAMSVIRRAEFSIDAGEWHFVSPIGGLSDAKAENYDFRVPISVAGTSSSIPALPSAGPPVPDTGEHLVVVRVYDRADNMSTAKFVVRPTPPPVARPTPAAPQPAPTR